MTLAELRAQLDALNLPDDTPVVLATDAEGHGFSPLHTAVDGMYEAHNAYTGQWYATGEQRAAANDDEWDQAPPSGPPTPGRTRTPEQHMPVPASRLFRTPAEPRGGPIPPGMRDAGPPHTGPVCLGPTGDWLCRQRADNGHSDHAPYVEGEYLMPEECGSCDCSCPALRDDDGMPW